MDTGSIISIVVFVLFWIVFLFVMFWFYGLTPILHWFIKSNGEQAKAVILEVKTAGWGWYTGRLGQSLVFQPVRVKLEVQPSSGAPYVAYDRFNAKPDEYWETIKPGAELQVSIARFNAQWVACWPETAAGTHEARYDVLVRHGVQPPAQAAAATSKGDPTPFFLGLGIVVVLLCACLLVAGGFALSRYVATTASSGINNQIATVLPVGSPTPNAPSDANASTIPTGGLANEITRATAWGQALGAILQADPTSCMSPDGAKTRIDVTHKKNSSGAWQERWLVACDGGPSIPVDISFTPAGGLVTTKATLVK